MYQITCDDAILYDIRIENRIVLSPVLNLETRKNGTLSFIIPPQNELYNLVKQKKSIIKVYQIDKIRDRIKKTELFRGTAYSEKIDFCKRKQIECEGELSFLCDSIVRPYDHSGDVESLFKQFINNHNNQVEEDKRFIPRNCNVIDPNGYITRANINYPTTKEEIDSKLVNILGGHFETGNDEEGTRFIDYLQEYEHISSQTIEFGKNLLDITQNIKTDDVVTRIIPLGKKDESTGEYLTIKSVNDGKDYVQDDAAIALFGVIEKTIIFEDVTVAQNLFNKGVEYLEEMINKTVSIDLTASDLHNLDLNVENFKIGENVRVISKPHSLDRYFLLSKLHLELDNLSNSKMTLGAVFKSFTQKQIESENQINASIISTENSVSETKKQVNIINNEVQEINTIISKVPSQYVSAATFAAYKQEVDQKLFGIYKIKGNVATYQDLLALQDKTVGDVYNILDTGANYVYTDNNIWDKLSETVDLSEYLKIQTANNTFTKITDFEALVRRVEALEGN